MDESFLACLKLKLALSQLWNLLPGFLPGDTNVSLQGAFYVFYWEMIVFNMQ